MERKRLSKEKRREQIKEVALKLFIENGYSKTTMDEIVQEVGISKGGCTIISPIRKRFFWNF